jgi:transposase InsO family protein
MIASPLPERPWQKIGSVRSDLFHHNGKDYIIAVDYYSRFFEVAPLKNTTSENIVNHLKSFFCHHGIPEIVMSDNGLQFSVATFSKFVDEWGFTHSTSSPYYPQSKGEAERAIKTAKSLFLKSEYPYLALLFYRTTPLQNGHTPAELLMGRKLRSTLPLSPEKLKPMLLDVEQLRKNEQTYKRQQTQDYNKRHRATCLSDWRDSLVARNEFSSSCCFQVTRTKIIYCANGKRHGEKK